MGLEIDRERFEEDDFRTFRQRLEEELVLLEALCARPDFGTGPASIGAELEIHLVDRRGFPSPLNLEVRDAASDPRVSLELNRYNLELNARPTALAGTSFGRLRRELEEGLAMLREAARKVGCRVALVGILPTLFEEHVGDDAMSDVPRYRALARALREMRGGPFEVCIEGEERLELRSEGVVPEGANTSFQVHLRVPPKAFADTYNAIQLVTAPLVAVAGNSPFFLGRRLWQETRVALFRQAVDERADAGRGWERPARVSFGTGWVRHGALELFREGVALHRPILPVVSADAPGVASTEEGLPRLDELRLHHGTVWSWNRAVYDPGHGGHLRVELRALPAGPTIEDMLANAAFAIGLALALAPEAEVWLSELPFAYARQSFYSAAEHGLEAEILWPHPTAPSPRPRRARELVLELVPRALAGLVAAGVDPTEAEQLLAVVEARARSGQTGARYQQLLLDRLEPRLDRRAALEAVLARYLERSDTGAPVHTWDLEEDVERGVP